MISESYRVLKPGAFFLLTGPFYWPLHEEPYDFFRFTKYGFESMLSEAGYNHVRSRPPGGDWAQIFLSINLKLKTIVGPFEGPDELCRTDPERCE